VAKRNVNIMMLRSVTAEQFSKAITEDPADKFAKTFVAKANMQEQWGYCVGAWDGDELMGAIITTVSKRKPHVANLQLLHTFAKHRRKGVAAKLCEDSLKYAKQFNAEYFRVSAEPDAVVFYERIGFKFLGRQKSGAQLSMFRIAGETFFDGEYDIEDPVIYKAVHKKGKGGCVDFFVENQGLTSFFN